MTTIINELYDIKAIDLVQLLPTDRPMKAVWVHQDKLGSAGNYLRTKSRICPQGFRFRPGVECDPDEIVSYAPHVQAIMIFSLKFNETCLRLTWVLQIASRCSALFPQRAESLSLLQKDSQYQPGKRFV
jgi:hypothetical protein